MTRILAIARLAIAGAVRSRVVVSLLGLLLLSLIGLPLTIRSDGTVTGHIYILLSYSLGAVTAILSVATLWAGSAAIAVEIADRQAQLLLTKPVHRLQVWLGKWLGLVALNAVLLGLAGAVVYGMLRWTTRGLSGDEAARLRQTVLVARSSVAPLTDEVDAVTDRNLGQLVAGGQLPGDADLHAARASLRQGLLRSFFSVGPGQSRTWRFPSAAAAADAQPALLRYRFSASSIGPVRVTGRWSFRHADGNTFFETEQPATSEQPGSLVLPPDSRAGGMLQVTFAHQPEEGVTLFFDPEDGIRWEPYATSFEVNYLRALFLVWLRLAFLAALGIATGALFSTPVALFTAFALLLLMQFGGYADELAQRKVLFPETAVVAHAGHSHSVVHEGEPRLIDHAFHWLFRAMALVLRPLDEENPLEALAGGRVLPLSSLVYALLVQVVLYGGLLALATSWILAHREVALPEI